MEHYVTLFDVDFAPQGLALHRSLQRHAGPHVLWVICVDEDVERLLGELGLPDVRTIALRDVEDDALRSVKPGRTRGEYCWTLTPFSFDAVFERDDSAQRVTYVDADVWLMSDPSPVFRGFEASGAAVQITEHAYAPEHDQAATSGRFCVQFLTMNRTGSTTVRKWWQDRCLEWCFARVEDGKFGDQKYLDDWPHQFGSLVHVTPDRSWFQAPWNATRFPYSEGIAYHFHGLRLIADDQVRLMPPGYIASHRHHKHVYGPYLHDLVVSVELIRSTGREPADQLPDGLAGVAVTGIRSRVASIVRRVIVRVLGAPFDRPDPRLAPNIQDLPDSTH
jgi:hypothetical protein